MKILFVISGDIWAGAEVQAYNLVSALAGNNYETVVVLFNDGELAKALRKLAVTILVLNEKQFGSLAILFKLVSLLKTEQPRVIHTHGFKENILASLANALSINVKCIRTVHGDYETKIPLHRPDKYFIRLLDRLAGKYLQEKIVVVSTQLAEKIGETYGSRKVELIENTINVSKVVAESRLPLARKYDEKYFKIAMVGRLVPLKRHAYIISIMPELIKKTARKVMLYIFGEGPEKPRLEKMIQELDLAGNVKLMGNRRPFYPHFSKMDLVIMPSDHEGLPMTLLEALVLKVPIVAHATGGIPNLLHDGEFGTLVRNHVESAYLNSIMEILAGPEQARAKADRGYEYALEHYDIAGNLGEYERLYIA